MDATLEIAVQVLKMEPADMQGATEMMAEALMEEEMFKRLHLTHHQVTECVGRFMAVCASNGLSVVAKDVFTKQTVGAICVMDYEKPFGSGETRFQAASHDFPEYAPVLELIKAAESNVHLPEGVRKVHILAIGVHPAYRKHGVVADMVVAALHLAKEKGYHMAVAECTSPRALKSLSRCGFQARGSYEFQKFEWDGARPFETKPFSSELAGSSAIAAQSVADGDRIVVTVRDM
eukprot:ANDGO_04301.mRNA.1 hypothetical protein